MSQCWHRSLGVVWAASWHKRRIGYLVVDHQVATIARMILSDGGALTGDSSGRLHDLLFEKLFDIDCRSWGLTDTSGFYHCGLYWEVASVSLELTLP